MIWFFSVQVNVITHSYKLYTLGEYILLKKNNYWMKRKQLILIVATKMKEMVFTCWKLSMFTWLGRYVSFGVIIYYY